MEINRRKFLGWMGVASLSIVAGESLIKTRCSPLLEVNWKASMEYLERCGGHRIGVPTIDYTVRLLPSGEHLELIRRFVGRVNSDAVSLVGNCHDPETLLFSGAWIPAKCEPDKRIELRFTSKTVAALDQKAAGGWNHYGNVHRGGFCRMKPIVKGAGFICDDIARLLYV